MILFVVSQIACAEYIYPLIQHGLEEEWEILASPVCGQFLTKRDIHHRILESTTLEQARSMASQIKPDKALIGASSNSPLEQNFVAVLRELGVPVMQFLDVWTNYSARFQVADDQGGMHWLLPDKILTIDDAARAGMIAKGLPGEIITIVGQPYFEMLADDYRRNGGSMAGGKTLLSTQPISKYYGKKLGYDEIDFVRCCCEAWQMAGKSWNDLRLGIHPAEQITAYAELQHQFGALSISTGAGKLTDYSRVMGMFSSTLIQGILAGCQVASVQPGALGTDACFLPASIPRFHEPETLAAWLSITETESPSNTENYSQQLLASLAGSRARVVSLLTPLRNR